jgi:hypothetical protein
MPYKRDVVQYFFYFATFSMKKNYLKFKTVKVEGFHPRSCLQSAATPQYPSKLKKLNFTIFSIIIISRLFLLRYAKQYRNSISTNAK